MNFLKMNSKLFITLISILIFQNDGNVVNAQQNSTELGQIENSTMYLLRTQWALNSIWSNSGLNWKMFIILSFQFWSHCDFESLFLKTFNYKSFLNSKVDNILQMHLSSINFEFCKKIENPKIFIFLKNVTVPFFNWISNWMNHMDFFNVHISIDEALQVSIW